MMAGAHRDAFFVGRLADVLGAAAVEQERHHAGALARRADQPHAGNGGESGDRACDQVVLVALDRREADASI